MPVHAGGGEFQQSQICKFSAQCLQPGREAARAPSSAGSPSDLASAKAGPDVHHPGRSTNGLGFLFQIIAVDFFAQRGQCRRVVIHRPYERGWKLRVTAADTFEPAAREVSACGGEREFELALAHAGTGRSGDNSCRVITLHEYAGPASPGRNVGSIASSRGENDVAGLDAQDARFASRPPGTIDVELQPVRRRFSGGGAHP